MGIDHGVRVLEDDELRTADRILRMCMHQPDIDDDAWSLAAASYQHGRTLGAFDGDELIGTASSFHTQTMVPGGARLPTSAVTRVGVRADRTRRGALSALMRAQLDAAARDGETLAQLRASEARIYGRFGYGAASRHVSRTVDRVRAGFSTRRSTTPVRLLSGEPAFHPLPSIYARIGPHRAGMVERPDVWWTAIRSRQSRNGWSARVALHGEPGAETGFVSYQVTSVAERTMLDVLDFQAGTDTAYRDLWQFLLDVDLVDDIRSVFTATDESMDLLLADPRASKATEMLDEVWLRLVDLPAALAARAYGVAEPVTIEVHDEFLPANSGRYRIAADGADPSSAEPDLRMDVDTLAALYLGDRTASRLATAGRIDVVDPAALPRADALFATVHPPWCGTFF